MEYNTILEIELPTPNSICTEIHHTRGRDVYRSGRFIINIQTK